MEKHEQQIRIERIQHVRNGMVVRTRSAHIVEQKTVEAVPCARIAASIGHQPADERSRIGATSGQSTSRIMKTMQKRRYSSWAFPTEEHKNFFGCPRLFASEDRSLSKCLSRALRMPRTRMLCTLRLAPGTRQERNPEVGN